MHDARSAHGRRIGQPGGDSQHVDAALAELYPQRLGQDEVKGLGGAVGRGVGGAGGGGQRGHEDDPAPAPTSHRPPKRWASTTGPRQLRSTRDRASSTGPVDEERSTVHCAGVVDQEAHLDAVDQADRGRPSASGWSGRSTLSALRPMRGLPDLGGQLVERTGAPGQQGEVDATLGHLAGKACSDALGRSGDQRPRPVALSKRGRSTTSGQPIDPFPGRVRSQVRE